jgi:hypothetical protein
LCRHRPTTCFRAWGQTKPAAAAATHQGRVLKVAGMWESSRRMASLGATQGHVV